MVGKDQDNAVANAATDAVQMGPTCWATCPPAPGASWQAYDMLSPTHGLCACMKSLMMSKSTTGASSRQI